MLQCLKKKWLLFPNDMICLVNFNASSGKSESLHFGVLLLSIAYKASAKKGAEELSLMTLRSDPNFEEKLFLFEKLHEKFDEF